MTDQWKDVAVDLKDSTFKFPHVENSLSTLELLLAMGLIPIERKIWESLPDQQHIANVLWWWDKGADPHVI